MVYEVSHQLIAYGQRISAIGVMTTRGIEDFYLVEGSINGEVFLNFVQRCSLSIVLPFGGDNHRSVLLDNAAIPSCGSSCEHGDSSWDSHPIIATLQLNPIEEVFSKVKAYIKDNEVVYPPNSPDF